jgi:hypothetical protein
MAQKSVSLLLVFLTLVTARPAAAQVIPIIDSPRSGAVLQGVVTIRGTSNVSGFQISEISFAYADDMTDTWFLISSSEQAVDLGTLAIWDTTTITDGNYTIRLRIFLADGSTLDATVQNLRVRNYSAIETPTPALLASPPTTIPTATMTSTPLPTPTAFPANPVVVTGPDISNSILYGGAGAFTFLIILGIYLRIRKL